MTNLGVLVELVRCVEGGRREQTSDARVEEDTRLEDGHADALRHGALLQLVVVLLVMCVRVPMPMCVRLCFRARLQVRLLPPHRRIPALDRLDPLRPRARTRTYSRRRSRTRQRARLRAHRRVRPVARVPDDVVAASAVRVVLLEAALLEERAAHARRDELEEEDAEDGRHGDCGCPVVLCEVGVVCQ